MFEVMKQIPKIGKIIIILVLIGVIFSFGMFVSLKVFTNTKTTKFGLQDVGELVTQSANLTIVVDNKKTPELFNKFKIPFIESRQVFSYDVKVDASVEFNKIDVKYNNIKREIVVKLPHSKIYKTYIDKDSLQVYLDDSNIFSRFNLKDNNEALKSIEKQAEADANSNGTLEAADDNAKRLINGIVKQGEYKDYKVIYKYIK